MRPQTGDTSGLAITSGERVEVLSCPQVGRVGHGAMTVCPRRLRRRHRSLLPPASWLLPHSTSGATRPLSHPAGHGPGLRPRARAQFAETISRWRGGGVLLRRQCGTRGVQWAHDLGRVKHIGVSGHCRCAASRITLRHLGCKLLVRHRRLHA